MPIVICSNCGKEKKHHAHGLCAACVQARRRVDHPGELAKIMKKHYAIHRERHLAEARTRYKTDPIIRFASAVNASSSRHGRSGTLTRQEIRSLFTEKFSDFPSAKCAYCGSAVVPGANASLDHIDPTGNHSLSNVVVACQYCNSSRGNAPVACFKERLIKEKGLLEHILRRNESALAAFLVEHYNITVEQILSLIKPGQ